MGYLVSFEKAATKIESNAYLLIHKGTGSVIAGHIVKARSLWSLGIGLLGQARMNPGKGMWLPGVRTIHTWGMRFPVDVLFLDADCICKGWVIGLPPGRIGRGPVGTVHTIELCQGTLNEFGLLRQGDTVEFELVKSASI